MGGAAHLKRALDLAVGIPATIVALPVIGVVACLVFATSGWPVFLVQIRVGADSKPIRVIKFRTMRRGVPTVAKSELERLPEIYTPVGPLLRRWSLDELPQLINVLRGDMSLVGPRPALPSQRDLLALRARHAISAQKPGITGLAQINGRESLSLATKVRFERLYARRVSTLLDLLILVRTIRALFSRRGAY